MKLQFRELKSGSEKLNSDSNSDAAVSWLKLGFEILNSDSNSKVVISWLKLGFENLNSDWNGYAAIMTDIRIWKLKFRF